VDPKIAALAHRQSPQDLKDPELSVVFPSPGQSDNESGNSLQQLRDGRWIRRDARIFVFVGGGVECM